MCRGDWNGVERREQDFREVEETVARHAEQAVAAVRMHSFLNTLDKYRPVVLSALFCFFIILATMAYGIINTNNRASENGEISRAGIRCVTQLTETNIPVEDIPDCEQFREK